MEAFLVFKYLILLLATEAFYFEVLNFLRSQRPFILLELASLFSELRAKLGLSFV